MTNPQFAIAHPVLADSPLLIALLFIFPFVVVVAIIYFAQRYERQRVEALRQIAEEIGLPFYPKGDDSLTGRLANLYLFAQGSSRKTSNMLHGQSNDVELAILDYQYTVGSGKNAHTYKQSVAYFHSPLLELPHFAMRPEAFFHKIGSAFGFQDIDFETHPAFSKAYLLRGNDEAAIRRYFHDDLLSFLETQSHICVEGGGDQLIYYRQAKRIKPEELRAFMEEGFQIYTAFRGEMSPANESELETDIDETASGDADYE